MGWAFISLIVSMLITSGTLAADKYWIAENGTGNWADANWANPINSPGTPFDSGSTAFFYLSINNIDLNGESPLVWTFRPGNGSSASNRRLVNIYNTSKAESTFTFKISGYTANDFKNMVVTFGGERSVGKVNVYNSKNNGNTQGRQSLKLAYDSHVVFAANSEYKEAGNREIATVASGATENVILDSTSTAINGRKASLLVEKGMLILNIQPPELIITFR
jgi:hypothetical protein